MSSPPISDTKNKRFNLKLPPYLRELFQTPYDSYLLYLLNISKDLTLPFSDEDKYLKDIPKNCQSSSSRWTLWVSKEIRANFDSRKLILCPTKTHAGFVELLLSYRNKLEKSGNLPAFNKDKLASISRRNSSSTSAGVIYSPNAVNFGIANDNIFSYSLIDPTIFQHSTMQQQLNFPVSQKFGISESDYEYVPRTEKKITRERPELSIQTSGESKKPRYSLGKPPLPPNANSYFSHSNTVTSLNDDFSALFAPTQRDFPSLDIFEATKLQNENYGNQQMLFNEFEHDFLTKDDTLPDLGAFYQPLNVNGFDFTL